MKKYLTQITTLAFLAALFAFALPSVAAVLVDDTWADGTRTNQNLPTESRWFASTAGNVAAYTNFYSITNLANGTGSSEWSTYFTVPGTPSQLGIGDTLTLTLDFVINGIGITNTSQNIRFALCDSSAGTRLSSDQTISAANYTGYAVFGNFGAAFGRSTGCFDLKRRTNLSAGGLLGTSSDWTSLPSGSGGSYANEPAFTNDGQYTLTISISRPDEFSVTLSASYSGGGLTNAWSATDATGVHTNFDTFVIRPSNGPTTASNFVFKRFKVEGPAGTPPAPKIASEPQPLTRVVGTLAQFRVGASGGEPLSYQWYLDPGTRLPGATNAILSLANVQLDQAGGYFAIVTNAQGVATSQVAQLTVNLPTYAPTGLVLDDRWDDADRIFGPVGSSNSVWFASASASFVAGLNSVLGMADPATSRLWLGYFTEDPSTPVDLDVGKTLQVTLVFTPTNPAPANPGSLGFGLFNYADGATRLTADNFGSGSTGNGAFVNGYLFEQNFGLNWGDAEAIQIRARNNLPSGNLMGSTGDYEDLGSGGVVTSNAPAFVSGEEYTLNLKATRTGVSSMLLESRIVGYGVDVSYSVADSTYAYRRFDAFGMRPNRTTDSAEQFNITRFAVQVSVADVPFRITSIERLDGISTRLTWESISNRVYQVESLNSLSTGNWVTNATITATDSATSYTNNGLSGILERYYRVRALP